MDNESSKCWQCRDALTAEAAVTHSYINSKLQSKISIKTNNFNVWLPLQPRPEEFLHYGDINSWWRGEGVCRYCTVLYCTVLYCIGCAGTQAGGWPRRSPGSRPSPGQPRPWRWAGDTLLFINIGTINFNCQSFMTTISQYLNCCNFQEKLWIREESILVTVTLQAVHHLHWMKR